MDAQPSYKSEKFEYLYRYPKRSRYWIYRRYSPEKGDSFDFSTKETSEKIAHTIGEKAFYKWLGSDSKDETVRASMLFLDFSEECLARSLRRPDSDFSKNSKRAFINAIKHLQEAFGHLRLDQITEEVWEDAYAEHAEIQERNGSLPHRFFNRRKVLLEIMRRAQRKGLIQVVPEYRNPDTFVEVGQYLDDETVSLLFKHAVSEDTRLLMHLVWRMGVRPGEALQYRWDMIDFKAGMHGYIRIPAAITKTRRTRRIPLNSVVSKHLKARQAKSSSAYVFPSPTDPGRPMGDYTTGWDGTCRRAGIKAGMYDLRRTFLTNQVTRGANILFLAKYVDSSVGMLERFYVKVHGKVFERIAQ